MALFFEKYSEEGTGSSVASGGKTTSSTERYRKIIVVYTKQMQNRNKQLKKIVKRESDRCIKRDENYQARREEKVLKVWARQLRKQRKGLEKQLGSSQGESMADNDNTSSGADKIEHQEVVKSDSDISAMQATAEKDILKAAVKQMKKQEKLLKKFLKEKKHGKKLDEDATENNENTYQKKSNGGASTTSKAQKGMSFLHKIGDVFLKALPNLLCVAIKSLFSCVFKRGKAIRFGSA